MPPHPFSRRSVLGALLVVFATGCGGGGGGGTINPPPPPPPPPEPLQVGDTAPLFNLEDVNPASLSFGQPVGPAARAGFVSAWYFTLASSTYAQGQFALLEQLVAEILVDDPGFRGEGIGVNAVGEEASNAAMVAGRTSPWLQDTVSEDAWGLWLMEQDDLVVLDRFGRVFALLNLGTSDLHDGPTYLALKQTLIDAGNAPPPMP